MEDKEIKSDVNRICKSQTFKNEVLALIKQYLDEQNHPQHDNEIRLMNGENSRLTRQNEELKQENEELKQENEELKKKIKEYDSVVSELRAELEKLQGCKNELNEQLQAFGEIESLWSCYMNLDDDIRGSLGRIYSGDKAGFVVSLVTQKTVNSLYEWLAYRQEEADSEIWHTVYRLYIGALTMFCRTNPDYSVIEASQGQVFDETKMAKSADSSINGRTVLCVVQNGYKTVAGTISKKTIVRV